MPCTLTCFGVGDGRPNGDRHHSSYLYEFGGVTLLIDCGEPVSRSYKASGRNYDLVDRIFLSHLHFDHTGGFFMLMQGFWLEQRQKELPVHMPAEGIPLFQEMLKGACLFDELLPFRLSYEPLRAGQTVPQGDVRVTPYHTSHLESFRKTFQAAHPGEYAAYSFLIEAPGLRIGHSADLGKPEDLEPLLREPLDLLVCELAHFEPESLFQYLQGRPIAHCIFVHLGRHSWQNLPKTRALAKRMLPGMKLSFPADLDSFSIPSCAGPREF